MFSPSQQRGLTKSPSNHSQLTHYSSNAVVKQDQFKIRSSRGKRQSQQHSMKRLDRDKSQQNDISTSQLNSKMTKEAFNPSRSVISYSQIHNYQTEYGGGERNFFMPHVGMSTTFGDEMNQDNTTFLQQPPEVQGLIKQRHLDHAKFMLYKKKKHLESLYSELTSLQDASKKNDTKYKALNEREQSRVISLKSLQELNEEELQKKHDQLLKSFNTVINNIELEDAEKDSLKLLRSRFKHQIFCDKQVRIDLEAKFAYTEKMLGDFPRLELMNKYRIVATEQSVSHVKQELNAKSQYRSQVLDKNHKTLEYETNQSKKLEEEYLLIVKQKEKAKRQLEKLRKLNQQAEQQFQNQINGLKSREVEKETLMRLYCLLQIRESLSNVQAPLSFQQASINNILNVDSEVFRDLKSIYFKHQALSNKIKKRLQLFDNTIKHPSRITVMKFQQRLSIIEGLDQYTDRQTMNSLQVPQKKRLDMSGRPKSGQSRASSANSRSSSQNSQDRANLSNIQQNQQEEKGFYIDLYRNIEYSGFLDFDDEELSHLMERRHVYLESISKLYNDLAIINKQKYKELESCQAELEKTESQKIDIEYYSQQKPFKRQRQNQKSLSYFELKHKQESLQNQIMSLRESINANSHFNNSMEGQVIELLRKVTFKIKVMDYIAIKCFDKDDKSSSSPPSQATPLNNNVSELGVRDNNGNHEISSRLIAELMSTRDLPSEHLHDMVIIKNKEIMDMVNIFEDQYGLTAEGAEKRFKEQKKGTRRRGSTRKISTKRLNLSKKSSKFVSKNEFHIELHSNNIFMGEGSNINSGSATSPRNLGNASETPSQIDGSPDKKDSSQNVSFNYDKGFLNSQAQKNFLKGILMKYKFVFLFTYFIKFCHIINQNSNKLKEGMNETISKVNSANFMNMFKSAYLTKFVKTTNEAKESDESFEKDPTPINKHIVMEAKKQSKMLISDLQKQIITPLDYIQKSEDKPSSVFINLEEPSPQQMISPKETNTLRKGLMQKKQSVISSHIHQDDSFVQEKDYMNLNHKQKKTQQQYEQASKYFSLQKHHDNAIVNRNNLISKSVIGGQASNLGMGQDFSQRSFGQVGYKKKIKEVSKLMKIFEKQDQNYIINMKQSVDKAQQAIRRLDTVMDEVEETCSKCLDRKNKHKQHNHPIQNLQQEEQKVVMFKRNSSMKNFQNVNFKGLFNKGMSSNEYADSIHGGGLRTVRDYSQGTNVLRKSSAISRTSSQQNLRRNDIAGVVTKSTDRTHKKKNQKLRFKIEDKHIQSYIYDQ